MLFPIRVIRRVNIIRPPTLSIGPLRRWLGTQSTLYSLRSLCLKSVRSMSKKKQGLSVWSLKFPCTMFQGYKLSHWKFCKIKRILQNGSDTSLRAALMFVEFDHCFVLSCSFYKLQDKFLSRNYFILFYLCFIKEKYI